VLWLKIIIQFLHICITPGIYRVCMISYTSFTDRIFILRTKCNSDMYQLTQRWSLYLKRYVQIVLIKYIYITFLTWFSIVSDHFLILPYKKMLLTTNFIQLKQHNCVSTCYKYLRTVHQWNILLLLLLGYCFITIYKMFCWRDIV